MLTRFKDRAERQGTPPDPEKILKHMQHVADLGYGGELIENIVEIFDGLTYEDREVVLKGAALDIWNDVLDKAQEELNEILIRDGGQSVVIDRKLVEDQRDRLEVRNFEEQMKLKTWLLKAMVVVGVLSLVGMIVLTVIAGGPAVEVVEESSGYLEEIYKVIKGK